MVKRKITIHLQKFAALIEQCSSKTHINQTVTYLRLSLQQTSFIPDTEHNKILEWYDFEFARVKEALNEAVAHSEENASK